MTSLFGGELTQSQLVISGLATGMAAIGVVFKIVFSAPVRESEAYQRGIADEASRCAEDIAQLRQQLAGYEQRISQLHDALLRLAVASQLSQKQRGQIAEVLGYRQLPDTLPEA